MFRSDVDLVTPVFNSADSIVWIGESNTFYSDEHSNPMQRPARKRREIRRIEWRRNGNGAHSLLKKKSIYTRCLSKNQEIMAPLGILEISAKVMHVEHVTQPDYSIEEVW